MILGIETSCDETAAALVTREGVIRANVVASQAALHARFGGVVPEIASRRHLELIEPVLREAFDEADATLDDVEAVAVTTGPGLIGALLVGLSAAKALAWARGLPLIPVDHLHGHVASLYLEPNPVEPPFLGLLASGGHTLLLDVQDRRGFTVLGTTLDDAAGEAFDKVAKLLGLGYPGGPVIEKLSAHGDPRAVKFPPAQIKHADRKISISSARAGTPAPSRSEVRFDFSYSGIKTAVLRYVETHDMAPAIESRRAALAAIAKPRLEDYLANCDKLMLDLVASFQRSMVDDLVSKTLAAAREYDVATLFVTGGVAANNELRRTFEQEAVKEGMRVFFPSRLLSTDNAAMIAAAAYPKFLAKDYAAMDFSAEAGMALK